MGEDMQVSVSAFVFFAAVCAQKGPLNWRQELTEAAAASAEALASSTALGTADLRGTVSTRTNGAGIGLASAADARGAAAGAAEAEEDSGRRMYSVTLLPTEVNWGSFHGAGAGTLSHARRSATTLATLCRLAMFSP